MIRILAKTEYKEEIKDITYEIEKAVSKAGVIEGIVFVHCPHTTCALAINENADRSVKSDLLMSYRELVKEDLPYRHAEGNSTAHIKTAMTGVSLNIFIENGKLALGTWQGVYLCEFDGPRNREIWLKILKG